MDTNHSLAPQRYRMLVLHPGERNSPIKCSLEHKNLASRPKFDALSYVWGSSVTTDEITCDSKPRQVGRNLHEALKRLRLPDKERVLWIDALCINQADNKEKTQQVRIMGEIYSRARNVFIWLGNNESVQKGVEKLSSRLHEEKPINWTPLKSLFTNPLFYQAQALLI